MLGISIGSEDIKKIVIYMMKVESLKIMKAKLLPQIYKALRSTEATEATNAAALNFYQHY